jgi:hypothetical protein
MRTVAAKAAASELAMLGVSLRRVAAGAGGGSRRTGVRLMALQALGMALGCTASLLRVAAFARCSARAAVRLVAFSAFGVPGQDSVLFGGVARGAVGLGRGVMWQALMATVAVRVTSALGDSAQLFGVAAVAQAPIGFG